MDLETNRPQPGGRIEVAQPLPSPESLQTIADLPFRQRSIDAWRSASQLRRLIDQWRQWWCELETTGDADPGLALRMAERVAVCVQALCELG
jgi:hypothetical protein